MIGKKIFVINESIRNVKDVCILNIFFFYQGNCSSLLYKGGVGLHTQDTLDSNDGPKHGINLEAAILQVKSL